MLAEVRLEVLQQFDLCPFAVGSLGTGTELLPPNCLYLGQWKSKVSPPRSAVEVRRKLD